MACWIETIDQQNRDIICPNVSLTELGTEFSDPVVPMNRNPGPDRSGLEGTFPEQLPLRDFWDFEDEFLSCPFSSVQDEGVASVFNHVSFGDPMQFHPLAATNPATDVPVNAYAIPVNIPSPHLSQGPPWASSFYSDQTYTLSPSDPIFSFSMDLGNTDAIGSGQSSNREPTIVSRNEHHVANNFLPELGQQFNTITNRMFVSANQDPIFWDPEQLLTGGQRMPPHLSETSLGILPASDDSQHLVSSSDIPRQSDHSSCTLDALSLPSPRAAQTRLQQQLPSSPSTLAQSANTPSETQDAPLSTLPYRNASFPSTSTVILLAAPPGFSHSHILLVTNRESSLSSLLDGAKLAELEKNSRLQALDVKYQQSDSQHRSSNSRISKKQRVGKQVWPSQSLDVSKSSDIASNSKGPETTATGPSSASSVHTSNNSASSEIQPKRIPKRKTDVERNSSTVQLRKEGACLRCRVMREKCSEGTRPCLRCLEVWSSKAMIHIPCQRATLDDVELYRRRTQIGLFVYYYKHANDQDLPTRTASIVDPNPLEAQLGQNCPLTVADTFELQSLGTFQRFSPNLLAEADQRKGLALRRASKLEDLKKSKVLAQYLELHITTIIDTLGTNNNFIATTLRVAEKYSRPERPKPSPKPMLRQALYIFAARFLRRTYWVQIDSATEDYRVAWMDAPWRALPTATPQSLAEAETLNQILKNHLCTLEKWVIEEFTKKVYARNKNDWFEIFLVTFIFQVILSENLEMSFYSQFSGLNKPIECPWSTFGGLRSYSSKRIASYFSAINGRDPFLKPGARAWEGFGDIERTYLDQCGILLKDGYTKKDDLGFRRSASGGDADSPGSWWKWAVETVLGEGLTSPG